MALSATKLREEVKAGRILIDPFNDANINPNSYDLTLGDTLLVYNYPEGSTIDPRKETPTKEIKIPDVGYDLKPGVLYLGHTVERAGSDMWEPQINGKSSIGRIGLLVHVTAGFGDVGFNQHWTLEIVDLHITRKYKIRLTPGMKICQIAFNEVIKADSEGETPDVLYRGKYAKSDGVVASRSHEDFE
ncbi:hypothetical protein LCGC14_0146650 [marine sediment metagenome]|uniref:dUTPase-like domain-containing protein n=1 Tax=marine sediment metagenome TaxID=412755 RepID=A0A0F9Y1I1_9ZZZZ